MPHVHRWVIESPHGGKSNGSCACGETKAFSNVIDDVVTPVAVDDYHKGATGFAPRHALFDYAGLPPVTSPRDSGRWKSLGVEGCYTLSGGGRSYD